MRTHEEKGNMLDSICKELGVSKILKVLKETPLRRLQPIFLEAWKKRAASISPTDIMNIYARKYQFYGASSFSQTQLIDFTRACFSVVPHFFDIVETSPITPLGLNSVLTKISQNNSLSTIRDSEVASDVTSQLALECSFRRKQIIDKGESLDRVIHLSSSHRVLRMQPFDGSKGYMQHFNLLGLCSGGRGFKDESFATNWVREHVSIILEMLYALRENLKLSFSDVVVSLSDIRFLEDVIKSLCIPRSEINQHSFDDDFDLFQKFQLKFPREVDSASELGEDVFKGCNLVDQTAYYSHLEKDILEPLRKKYPSVRFCFDFTRKAGLGYYKHVCFHIFATNQPGRRIQVADGGAVDWSEKLLQNKKEAMVTSGIGSELVHKLFL